MTVSEVRTTNSPRVLTDGALQGHVAREFPRFHSNFISFSDTLAAEVAAAGRRGQERGDRWSGTTLHREGGWGQLRLPHAEGGPPSRVSACLQGSSLVRGARPPGIGVALAHCSTFSSLLLGVSNTHTHNKTNKQKQ